MEYMDTIKLLLFKKVERFCDSQGITLKHDDLVKHINITSKEVLDFIAKPKAKKKILIKPKKSSKKLILKTKPKLLKKKKDYNIFTTICDANKLQYFQFYDEHSWIGPAINIKSSQLDEIRGYFKSLKTTKITGTNFYIIRPTINLNDDNIIYPDTIDGCKLESESLIGIHSDNEIYDISTEDEIELEEWKHEATNTKYMIDPYTNTVYSFHTNEPVGKKIDAFTIDFNLN